MIRPWETVNGERDKGRTIIRKPITPKRRKPAPLDTDIRRVLTAVCIGGFIGERIGPGDTGNDDDAGAGRVGRNGIWWMTTHCEVNVAGGEKRIGVRRVGKEQMQGQGMTP